MTDLKLTPPVTTKLSVNFGVTTADAILRLLFKLYPDGSSDTIVAPPKAHDRFSDITIFATGTGLQYRFDTHMNGTVMFSLVSGHIEWDATIDGADSLLLDYLDKKNMYSHTVEVKIPGDVYDEIVANALSIFTDSAPLSICDTGNGVYRTELNLRSTGYNYDLTVAKRTGSGSSLPEVTITVSVAYHRLSGYIRPTSVDNWWPLLHIENIYRVIHKYVPFTDPVEDFDL